MQSIQAAPEPALGRCQQWRAALASGSQISCAAAGSRRQCAAPPSVWRVYWVTIEKIGRGSGGCSRPDSFLTRCRWQPSGAAERHIRKFKDHRKTTNGVPRLAPGREHLIRTPVSVPTQIGTVAATGLSSTEKPLGRLPRGAKMPPALLRMRL